MSWDLGGKQVVTVSAVFWWARGPRTVIGEALLLQALVELLFYSSCAGLFSPSCSQRYSNKKKLRCVSPRGIKDLSILEISSYEDIWEKTISGRWNCVSLKRLVGTSRQRTPSLWWLHVPLLQCWWDLDVGCPVSLHRGLFCMFTCPSDPRT